MRFARATEGTEEERLRLTGDAYCSQVPCDSSCTSGNLSAFLAVTQLRFLLGAAPLLRLPPPDPMRDLSAWLEATRSLLLDRHPGFGETLMAWPSRLPTNPRAPFEPFTTEAMGRAYEEHLGRTARQKQGTFYTAAPLIRRLLEAPLEASEPRLLDPAMGCGAFLSEALAMRDPGDAQGRWDFACRSLFGVERDPLAREIAVLALWLRIGHPLGDPRALQANLRVGDSLLSPELDPSGIDWVRAFAEPMRHGGFTAVVGNPPFLNIERLEPAARELYRQAFPSARKRFDLFIPMAERALDLTRPGGRIALVLPHPFLTQAYGEGLRRRYLTETTLQTIEEVAFPGAAVRTILLSARKQAPVPESEVAVIANGESERLPQAPLIHLPEARIPSRGGKAFAIAHQALSRGIPLGTVAFATWGVRGVPIEAFHRDSPDHPACRRMIKGEGIEPYQVNWGGKWLRYEPERLYRPLFRELFEGEKIVLRKVSGSRGLVAALDREGYYTDDSVLCCQLRKQLAEVPESVARRYGMPHGNGPLAGMLQADSLLDAYDLPVLLGFLNSRLAALVFDLLLGNGLNVYPGALMRLPLPPFDATGFAALRTLVSRRLAFPREASKSDHAIEACLAGLFGVELDAVTRV